MTDDEAREPRGLRFLSNDEYLAEFGWRGRFRLVRESLRRADVRGAWRWAWRAPRR